jgi:hypothetical protein
MALVRLVQPQGTWRVLLMMPISKFDLFKNNPGLTIAFSHIHSAMSLDELWCFISRLEDQPIDPKDRNFPELSQLSKEFNFQALSARLSTRWRSLGLAGAQTGEIVSRISNLEEDPT